MTDQKMKYGARKGRMSTMRRLVANASANDLRVFPVPGADLLRLYQTESEMDALLAVNPREANVLLVVGELTDQLAQKAGVAYQQIPRPRVLVVAGAEQPLYLPEPDVQVSLRDGFLDEALPKVRQLLQDHAWSENAEPWEPEFLTEMLEDSQNGGGHDHHDHDHGNGRDDDGHNHEGHDHGHEENAGDDESHDHHSDDDHDDEDHDGNNGHNHNHHHDGDDGHDHGDMDFMSMVAMTKDLPRPKDGLPMNRSEVHFGPFHPGLPGGLSIFMELDGDTVIEATVEGNVAARSLEKMLPIEVETLPDLLAQLNPLTPETYRLLAKKALADEKVFFSNEIVLLENERIGSHLNWLATFAKTLGNEWMHQEAARWHVLHCKKEASAEKLVAFLEQIRSMPYLKTKLSVGGVIPDTLLHHLSGPAAKAAGKTKDARSDDELYQSLGWEPIIKQGNSAWGRLLVRLKEIEQSTELISKAKNQEAEKKEPNYSGSGEEAAKLESPRGTVSIHISIDDGKVQELHLKTPSKPLAALVPVLTEEAELSDALVQIGSLDISPWEIEPERARVH